MKPLLRGHFHQAMFFVVLGAGLSLLIRCGDLKEAISVTVYTVCALLMFGISSLYHRINWDAEKRLLWRKLDHCGIYLMIAGTFTPIALLGLSPQSSLTLLLTIWGVAIFGIFQSLFFVNLPKFINAVFYIIAGYLILPYLPELTQKLGQTQTGFILTGGILYTIGAICYALKRPVFSPQFFGYHEVFHLFVNFAAAFHFVVVSSLI